MYPLLIQRSSTRKMNRHWHSCCLQKAKKKKSMMQTTKEVITAANIHLHILLLSVGCCSAEKHRAPSVVPCSSIRLSVPVCKYGPRLSSSTGGNTRLLSLRMIACRRVSTLSGEMFEGSTDKHATNFWCCTYSWAGIYEQQGICTGTALKLNMHGRSSWCLEACDVLAASLNNSTSGRLT